MARARNIKPGLFKNEILGVADPLYTILFEGLWTLADREGRLEDRPLRIKGEIFPYREGIDIGSMLDWLQANGFIRRYTAAGKKCIFIIEFRKHQNPHKNEAESELPAPDDLGAETDEIGKTSEKIGSTPADLLIPDSPTTDSGLLKGDASPKAPPAAQGKRLPEDWQPTPDEIAFCKQERPDLDPALTAARFRDYWIAQPGVKGRKSNWAATWRNWVRDERGVKAGAPPPASAGIWHETDAGYQSKAEELGLQRKDNEPFQWFKWRIAKKVGDQGVIDKLLSAAQRDGIAEHERAFQFFHGRSPNSALRAPEEA